MTHRPRRRSALAILLLLGCLSAAAQPESGRLAVAGADLSALRDWDALVE